MLKLPFDCRGDPILANLGSRLVWFVVHNGTYRVYGDTAPILEFRSHAISTEYVPCFDEACKTASRSNSVLGTSTREW